MAAEKSHGGVSQRETESDSVSPKDVFANFNDELVLRVLTVMKIQIIFIAKRVIDDDPLRFKLQSSLDLT